MINNNRMEPHVVVEVFVLTISVLAQAFVSNLSHLHSRFSLFFNEFHYAIIFIP